MTLPAMRGKTGIIGIKQQGRAFTVIELICSVAIVIILSALILVAVLKSQSMARKAKCVSNVRQIALAIDDFASAYGCLPLASNPDFFKGKNPEHQSGWMHALMVSQFHQKLFDDKGKALIANGIFDCPSASKPSAKSWPPSWDYADYGYNAFGLGSSDRPLGLGAAISNTPVKLSSVTAPSSVYAVGDGFKGLGSQLIDGGDLLWRTRKVLLSPDNGGTERSLTRHQGKVNIGFLDGHAETLDHSVSFSSTDEDSLKHWNIDNQPHQEGLGN